MDKDKWYYIVVTGNLSDGFRFHGPYSDFDDAASSEPAQELNSWVAPLNPAAQIE